MRKLRYAFIILAGLFFFSILLGSSIRNIYLTDDGGKGRLGFLAKPLKFIAETPSLVKQLLQTPEFYVENSVAKDGLSKLDNASQNSYPKLLFSYKLEKFGQKFDLVDLNNGARIKQWAPNNAELYEKAYNENNPRRLASGSDLYFMHPHMTADSSLLFTAQLTSLLARIDKEAAVEWVKNDKIYHHTIEPDGEGNIYVCSQPFESAQYDFLPGEYEIYKSRLLDDHISILNEKTGEETFSKSIISILLENGYEDLLLYKGQVISDPVHLNDIQPALSSTAYWEKGDVLVSCRNISTVFLYRPSTNKILWLRHGPWYNQHDVDFHMEGQIVVFGNDVIREESVIDPRIASGDLNFNNKRVHNEVYVYDFGRDTITTPFTNFLRDEKVRTITSGRCDILANGQLYVEETNNGRILVGDSLAKKLEYVKRIDDQHISSLFWSRIIN